MRYKIFILLIFAMTTVVFAQNYEDCINPLWYFQNFGSADAALANNSTASSNGVSGLASNPATLGLQKNQSISISFRNNNLTQNSRFINTGDLISSSFNNSDLMKTNLDGINVILPIPVYRGSLTFGLSYSMVANYFDQAQATGDFIYDDSPFTVENSFEKLGTMNVTRLGLAFEWQKNFFIGTSLNYYRGKQDQKYNYTDRDISDNFIYSSIHKTVEVNPDYSGVNFNLGLVYKTEFFKFGANISTPFRLHVEEKYNTAEKWTYDDGTSELESTSDRIKYKVKSPSSASAGIEYQIGFVSLLLDMKMQDWHNMEFISNLNDEDGLSTDTRINSEIRNTLKTTFDYGIGISTRVFDDYKINVGHRVISLPYYDLPQGNKNVHLTGIGLETQVIENFRIGLTYQFELGKNTIDKQYFEYPIYRKYTSQNFVLTTSLVF